MSVEVLVVVVVVVLVVEEEFMQEETFSGSSGAGFSASRRTDGWSIAVLLWTSELIGFSSREVGSDEETKAN
jgi:hypothetical protein